jgi:hypothetical protein
VGKLTKFKSITAVLALFLAIPACTMDPNAGRAFNDRGPATLVTIGGEVYTVWPSKSLTDRWESVHDHGKFNLLIKRLGEAERNQRLEDHITAIEKASGCKVDRTSMVSLSGPIQLLAGVIC